MEKIKLENLTYQGGSHLELISCPLCAAKEFKTLVVEQTIPIVRCQGCSLVFANPRPDREGLQKFYDGYFPPESAELWQKQMAEIFRKEGLERIQGFQQKGILKLPQHPKLLDIGCGMGFFLKLMQEAGWEVEGVEPAPEAARHAQTKLGLKVFEGTIESARLSRDYDVVTLWYVLEHVPNPHEILQKASEVLKPGGLVIIRVPNQNIPIDQILNVLGLQKFFLMNPPRHLFDYSPKTLSALLEQKGLKTFDIRNGIPRQTGTRLELLRRYAWFGCFEFLYYLSGKKILRGSSMTIYAIKN